MSSHRRFGVIGYGAITDELVRCLELRGEAESLAAVLVRPSRAEDAARRAAGRFQIVDRLEALLDLAPAAVAECAGQDALREYGPAILRRGVDLVIASSGALADRAFASLLCEVATHGARLWIPPGAVAGVDGLLAARTAGLREVLYTSVKAPSAWSDTPAEATLAGEARNRRTVFFEGSAREAALAYPRNANVAATVALASLGLDATRVRLVSDPQAAGPIGTIEAAGDFGAFRFETLAYAAASNPKTSALTAHSIAAALLDGVAFEPPARLLC
ncbi:MAG TPA: aspartate dehydrogenase [Burkholderiales bacterium]|nr:aspartate dehydrogenase [Burkholderiales bacterium]